MAEETKDIVKPQLNPQQEEFCKLFASDREFFGNGVQAYAEAYNIDLSIKGKYLVAKAAASRLLTNVNVLAHIDHLLELRGLNDTFVDKQLEFLVTQNAELSTKLSAIKEYNAMKKRTSGEASGNTYNTFIQQNNLNPNTPEAKELVDSTLEMLMNKTRRVDD